MSDERQVVRVDGLDVGGYVFRVAHDVGEAVEGEHDGGEAGLREFLPEGGEDGPGGFGVGDAEVDEVFDFGVRGEGKGEVGVGLEGQGGEVRVGF